MAHAYLSPTNIAMAFLPAWWHCSAQLICACCGCLLCRQVLGLRRQNHHLQQQVSALQEELDAIMSIELDDRGHAAQDSRPMQLQALQEQLMRHHQQHSQHSNRSSSRPQSAVAGPQAAARGRARPMTAGPASSVQQLQGGRWRPLSGSPKRRPGGTGK